jgi:glycosyltransferase involved in cell wall biosynthesis
MEKVLILTYYWPPSGGSGVQRWLKFVKFLPSFGWKPYVYTVENGEYVSFDAALQQEVPEEAVVVKRPVFEPFGLYRRLTGGKKEDKIIPGFLDEGMNRDWKSRIILWIRSNVFIPDARMFWIRPSIKFLKKYIADNQIKTIITTGPPHSLHLIGLKLKEELDLTWIADFRDPWTSIDYFEKLDLTKFARKKHHSLEKKVLTTADEVITVGKTMKEEFQAISGREIRVLYNGYDEDDIAKDIDVQKHKSFTISYFGVMGDARNHPVFWKGIKKLIEEDDIFRSNVKVKITGEVTPTVKKSIQELQLQDFVEFLPYLPHNRVIEEEKKSSLLYLSINRIPSAKGIVTGKLFEYMVSGVPIICIGPIDGDAAELISLTNSGCTVDFDDLDGFIHYVRYAFQQFIQGEMETKARDISIFSRKAITGELVKILNEHQEEKQSGQPVSS